MAHTCHNCGMKCHCGGDIDDLVLDERYDCNCCSDDEDMDEDEYYEGLEKMEELLDKPTR